MKLFGLHVLTRAEYRRRLQSKWDHGHAIGISVGANDVWFKVEQLRKNKIILTRFSEETAEGRDVDIQLLAMRNAVRVTT